MRKKRGPGLLPGGTPGPPVLRLLPARKAPLQGHVEVLAEGCLSHRVTPGAPGVQLEWHLGPGGGRELGRCLWPSRLPWGLHSGDKLCLLDPPVHPPDPRWGRVGVCMMGRWVTFPADTLLLPQWQPCPPKPPLHLTTRDPPGPPVWGGRDGKKL